MDRNITIFPNNDSKWTKNEWKTQYWQKQTKFRLNENKILNGRTERRTPNCGKFKGEQKKCEEKINNKDEENSEDKLWHHIFLFIFFSVYLSPAKMIEHFQPNISLMVVWWHRSQKWNMNIFIGKCCVTRWNAYNWNEIKEKKKLAISKFLQKYKIIRKKCHFNKPGIW